MALGFMPSVIFVRFPSFYPKSKMGNLSMDLAISHKQIFEEWIKIVKIVNFSHNAESMSTCWDLLSLVTATYRKYCSLATLIYKWGFVISEISHYRSFCRCKSTFGWLKMEENNGN